MKFGALNANSFKTVEDTNFKFGTDAPRESPDMTPEKLFRKGGVARVTWPLKFFLALNANSSKMIKDTNFKFGIHAPRESPDMAPENFSNRGRGQGHVTD